MSTEPGLAGTGAASNDIVAKAIEPRNTASRTRISNLEKRDSRTLPGYGPDVQANRAEARKLMTKHGYGPDKRLPVKVATRNIAQYRDPAIILIDQMKEIYIDGEPDAVETANCFPKIARKDLMVG